MQARPRESNECTQIMLHPYRFVSRNINGLQYRILPSLKKIVQEEPINFKLYERAKKNRRLKMVRPLVEQNFFLEGQFVNALPNNLKMMKQKYQHIDFTASLLQRNEGVKIYQQVKKMISPYSIASEDESLQLHHSQSKCKNVPLPIKYKVHHGYNTLQPKFKQQSSSRDNANKSLINLKMQEGDRQKQLFYLEKKQAEKIRAESFIVMQYPAMRILTGNRYKNQAEIASLTKIMTCYTVLQLATQYRIDLTTQNVVIGEDASNMTGTSAELAVGDVLTVEQLLYGLMLPSGNDAAVALGEWGGALAANTVSIAQEITPLQIFVGLMNKHAKLLQLKTSSFGNPHGLPNYRNTSTPYDLALLIAACFQLPLFFKIVSTQMYKTWVKNEGGKKEMIWQNTNKLLRRQGFIGVKTGVTITAGPCLASCYQLGDKKFIVVLLRTNKLSRRFKETRLLLGWTLRTYGSQNYQKAAKKILKNDPILDSDNSQDENEFSYGQLDAQELAKRNKILQNQL